jgi:cytochrome d ubiquinol oxidase subunit I
MLFGAFLTTSMCVAATGAWHRLRGTAWEESRVMLDWGLGLAAVLIPAQILFGHLAGDIVHKYQPAKFAAIEARWHDEQPAAEVLVGWPDEAAGRNLYAISIPRLGSFIATGTWDSKEVGLDSFPPQDRPPVLIPFWAFRIMVGMALVMLAISWGGVLLRALGRLEDERWFLWLTFLSFPTGFVAVLAGWFTAEVGRQPWVVYGLLRTKDAVTPSLSTPMVLASLTGYILVYSLIYAFGVVYFYRLMRDGLTKKTPPATGYGLETETVQ